MAKATGKRKKVAHTPTPYEVIVDSVGNNPDIMLNAKGYGFVAKIPGGLPEVREANAKFIAKACNKHEALVETVNRLVDYLANKVRFKTWPTIGLGIDLRPAELDELLLEAEQVMKGLKRK